MRYRAIPEYYDAEYEHQDFLDQDVPFFLEHLKHRQTVLELAVGTGRAAIPIAQAGHRVVGIDHHPGMLRLAEQKRNSVGLKPEQLELLEADILRLNLRRKFDWVCLLFNTFLLFTTLQEQDRALQNIRRHLKPTGRLWLDIFNPDPALLAEKESKNHDPKTFYVPQFDRTVFRSVDIRRNLAAQVQRITFNYIWFDQQGRQKHQRREFDLTFIFPRELQILLERNGLKIEHLYGNHAGSKLTSDSPRMIACCQLLK